MKKINYFNEKGILFFSIFLFLFIRVFFFYKGVNFNGFGFWQIANLELLGNDLLKTIYYFHYQPPLWNLLIGSLQIITEKNEYFSKNILLFLHWCFSIGILIIIYNLKLKLKFSNKIYVLSLLFLIINPSLIFFENFALYNHFSCFIFFLIFYNFFLLSESNNIKNEYYILLLSLVLILTWPIFHPVLMIIIFCLITLIKKKIEFKSLIITIIFLTISLAPSIKNKYEFGFFGNGSGLGQNMSGLIFWNDQLRKECSYNNLSKENKSQTNNAKHQILLYENHVQNSQKALNLSKYCLKSSIQEIRNNFIVYAVYRLRVLLASHNRFSFEYFQPPKNFNNFFNIFDKLKKDNFWWTVKKLSINFFFLIYYSTLIIYFFKFKDNKHLKNASISIFILHLYILIIGTFLNNQEQERFRYTSGIFLNFLFFYIMFRYHTKFLELFKTNK